MKKFFIAVVLILCLMFAEYRFIMLNQCPYVAENGTIYVEIFGNVDEYHAEPASELEFKTTKTREYMESASQTIASLFK